MKTDVINISKQFGDFKALNSINLTIKSGEFVAILGPSGCGKSTLLRMIAGFELPSVGDIKMDGEMVSTPHFIVPPEKRNINMVFQSFALWPHKTVYEHVEYPLIHNRFSKKDPKQKREDRINEVLEIVGLNHLEKRYPHQLSGGQRQRVALARAIAGNPSLLLMDEPLSSLDAELRMEMRREIQQIHRITKTAILYVTHDQSEALAMADKIVVMKGGKIEQIGTPETIFCYPESEFVATFVGKANIIEGQWEERWFFPSEMKSHGKWDGKTISPVFKENSKFPVRPEQFRIVRNGEGIPGQITTVQYQGKEIHYTVGVGKQMFVVHSSDLHKRYEVGEQIILQYED